MENVRRRHGGEVPLPSGAQFQVMDGGVASRMVRVFMFLAARLRQKSISKPILFKEHKFLSQLSWNTFADAGVNTNRNFLAAKLTFSTFSAMPISLRFLRRHPHEKGFLFIASAPISDPLGLISRGIMHIYYYLRRFFCVRNKTMAISGVETLALKSASKSKSFNLESSFVYV